MRRHTKKDVGGPTRVNAACATRPNDASSACSATAEPRADHVWFQDMADFAVGISNREASERLSQALRERRPFRRFQNELCEHHPAPISAWHRLSEVRAQRRAV